MMLVTLQVEAEIEAGPQSSSGPPPNFDALELEIEIGSEGSRFRAATAGLRADRIPDEASWFGCAVTRSIWAGENTLRSSPPLPPTEASKTSFVRFRRTRRIGNSAAGFLRPKASHSSIVVAFSGPGRVPAL